MLVMKKRIVNSLRQEFLFQMNVGEVYMNESSDITSLSIKIVYFSFPQSLFVLRTSVYGDKCVFIYIEE